MAATISMFLLLLTANPAVYVQPAAKMAADPRGALGNPPATKSYILNSAQESGSTCLLFQTEAAKPETQ